MEEYGFQIELIEGDMLDLSPLHGRDFDLVYQPPSAHFVRDIHQVYGEIARVLRKRGYYFVSHWNLLYQQLSDPPEWDGRGQGI
jgi:ubiquinone/menaquinone biosynthesis C-methylase UbiE